MALAIADPGGNDTVAIWDAVERVRLVDLPLSKRAGEVAFHANGTTVVASDRDRMRFWDLDDEQAAARICNTLNRGLTREEWAEFVGDQPYRATCRSPS